ncbi:hypothetical protein BDV97DRAFT_370979 [Delphinella strobiligena]|nr:hypothetical protein BDV97DRAFT_370979 [Delphinella strobiligena]
MSRATFCYFLDRFFPSMAITLSYISAAPTTKAPLVLEEVRETEAILERRSRLPRGSGNHEADLRAAIYLGIWTGLNSLDKSYYPALGSDKRGKINASTFAVHEAVWQDTCAPMLLASSPRGR